MPGLARKQGMAENIYLLVDSGSIYTKIVALDVAHDEVLGRSQSPTTAHTIILDGLKEAMGRLTIRGLPVDEATVRRSKKLASSSAAGGLRIVAVGLVPETEVSRTLY